MSVQGVTALVVAIAGLVTAVGGVVALFVHSKNAGGK